jgi:hypothetical protein
VGRRLLALGLAVALQTGALTAPLVHAHLGDDHDDHHASGAIHAHIHGHGVARPGHDDHPALHSEEGPERIVPLKLFLATHVGSGPEPVLAPVQFLVAPPAGSLMRRPPQVVRSHGPPPIAPSTPRAPPLSPVLI